MSKKFTFIIPLAILLAAILIAACGSTTTGTSASGTRRANGGFGGGNTPLPPVSIYLIGTFKLEGTDNAVDSKTAAALLPLYQVLKELSSNNTTAQAEIDAVADQIKSSMTSAQIQAIAAMNLTQQDQFALMQQLGGTGRTTTGTPRAGAGGGGGGFGPGGGGGGFGPGGGGGGGGASTSSANLSVTIAAAQTRQASAARLPSSALLTAMIQLLQQRAGLATDTPVVPTP